MAQHVKAIVAKFDNLNSIPRTHVVEGESCLPQTAFLSPSAYLGMSPAPDTHTINVIF